MLMLLLKMEDKKKKKLTPDEKVDAHLQQAYRLYKNEEYRRIDCLRSFINVCIVGRILYKAVVLSYA